MDAMEVVDDIGLPVIVVEDGVPRATDEAAALLALRDNWTQDDLVKMFGLDVEVTAANPIARAVRARCAVSDRMVIADGAGATRLVEVTTLPSATPGTLCILVRELKDARCKPTLGAEPILLSMPDRRTGRGMTPRARQLLSRAAAR